MRQNKNSLFITFIPFLLLFLSCDQDKQWKGQDPIQKVDTHTVPIQLQWKGIYDLGEGIYMSNEFVGARLNGVARTNDTLITVLISPENEKINPSPWYAFKIWSETPKSTYIRFSYPENTGHRYYPKISKDGKHWELIDSASYRTENMMEMDGIQIPKNCIIKVNLNSDTLFISAQELITSIEVGEWMDKLDTLDYVSSDTIGESQQGRPIELIKIGNGDDEKMIFILSRQHPPEVTGFLAMQAFIERLCASDPLAVQFRNEYTVYVVPLANPDGVDNGHWRNNGGGVDMNRDWADFNQPETRAIRDWMKNKTRDPENKFYAAIDFHSTWEDIYYTEDSTATGNMPGLIPELIRLSAGEFEGYEANIKSGLDSDARVSSSSYFFYEFGAESFTYEIGDNTDRKFVREKGKVSAEKLMGLMTSY